MPLHKHPAEGKGSRTTSIPYPTGSVGLARFPNQNPRGSVSSVRTLMPYPTYRHPPKHNLAKHLTPTKQRSDRPTSERANERHHVSSRCRIYIATRIEPPRKSGFTSISSTKNTSHVPPPPHLPLLLPPPTLNCGSDTVERRVNPSRRRTSLAEGE